MEGLTILTDRRYTYEDYLKLDDGRDYEVVGGKLVMVPRPGPRHQKIVSRLVTVLEGYLRQNRAGELYLDVDVLFGDQVVSPDLVIILKDRLSIVQETNISGAPDLVVEVLSPSTAKYDRKEKSQLYYAGGVQEYWLVDPSLQLVEVFVRGEKDWNRSGIYDEGETLVSPLLPGLEIELKNIFME
jgi:Uma2 family endonuclease